MPKIVLTGQFDFENCPTRQIHLKGHTCRNFDQNFSRIFLYIRGKGAQLTPMIPHTLNFERANDWKYGQKLKKNAPMTPYKVTRLKIEGPYRQPL